ncbi:hypothetical protein SK128_012831 [Halocaridina rubra]|uniref:Uncharacterized protein n=1 Tax=Halocaridina rubra TaxID=373956 RepID=A0AAN8X066_HALRR
MSAIANSRAEIRNELEKEYTETSLETLTNNVKSSVLSKQGFSIDDVKGNVILGNISFKQKTNAVVEALLDSTGMSSILKEMDRIEEGSSKNKESTIIGETLGGVANIVSSMFVVWIVLGHGSFVVSRCVNGTNTPRACSCKPMLKRSSKKSGCTIKEYICRHTSFTIRKCTGKKAKTIKNYITKKSRVEKFIDRRKPLTENAPAERKPRSRVKRRQVKPKSKTKPRKRQVKPKQQRRKRAQGAKKGVNVTTPRIKKVQNLRTMGKKASNKVFNIRDNSYCLPCKAYTVSQSPSLGFNTLGRQFIKSICGTCKRNKRRFVSGDSMAMNRMML